MTMARWQRTIVDQAGNILPGASVEVRSELTGALAALKSDRAGSTGIANPFTAHAVTAFAAFYVTGGAYKITVTSGALTFEWRHVGIGTAQEVDLADLATFAALESRIHTATGNVTVAPGDMVVIVKKTVGGATTANLPAVALHPNSPVILKDGKGDANTNPITPVFDGSELCDGSAGSVFQITTPFGWVRFDPLPDGSGWTRLGEYAVATDGTLAANSDTKIPSQKAVKTYADALIAANDAMVFKGVIDCSANPNYPAADRGHTYRVSVAGKIGGASGTNVEAGDLLVCLTDGTASGTQAGVGSSWTIAQTNLDGAVIGPASATDSSLARFDGTTGKLLKNGAVIGTDVQAFHARLADWAGITYAQGDIFTFNGTNIVKLSPGTSGHFLKSQGAGANVIYAAVPGGGDVVASNNGSEFTPATFRDNVSAFGIIRPRTPFTASGTYTPDADLLYCIIECIGGGGGTGGMAATSAGTWRAAGGAGAGNYSRLVASAATIGASKTVTIGAGGTAGLAAGPTAGGAGGDTSVGTLCIGKGAVGTAADSTVGGAGGVAGTGDLSVIGNDGGAGNTASILTVLAVSGFGGAGHFGGGVRGVNAGAADGGLAGRANTGGGAAGSTTWNANAANGSAGGSGIVFITEFCSK